MPREKGLFALSFESHKVKAALQVEYSRESPDRSNNDNYLRMRRLKELQPPSASSSCCHATGFHQDCRLLIFKATLELENQIRRGEVKFPQSLLVLLRFQNFSWINAPQIAPSICLISRILKKFNLTTFANFPIDFME